MVKKVPLRIAKALVSSLKGGVTPRLGLEHITVGRKAEIEALLKDVDLIGEGGASFRFIVGRYGSGKSFLLQTIRNYTVEKNYVVMDADLSPERRLTGSKGQGLATYKELIKNMSTKTKPDGGALPLILEKWISNIKNEVLETTSYEEGSDEFNKEVKLKIFSVLNSIESLVNGFDFAKILDMYWQAYLKNDEDKKSNILKWFRGEYANKTEAKAALGINIIVTDDNWYDYIKIFALFLVQAGYKGLMLFIDEIVNIYKIPQLIARQYNYEKILAMYNDILQGKAMHIGVIMGGTPEAVEDDKRGIFSYEALRSRLIEGRFSKEGFRDMSAPIIRLEPLTYEEMYILIEKLATIHADLYDYTLDINPEDYVNFLKIEYERIGADTLITPREVIRDFIEILNIRHQYEDKTIADIIGDSNFSFAKGEDEADLGGFAEFEL